MFRKYANQHITLLENLIKPHLPSIFKPGQDNELLLQFVLSTEAAWKLLPPTPTTSQHIIRCTFYSLLLTDNLRDHPFAAASDLRACRVAAWSFVSLSWVQIFLHHYTGAGFLLPVMAVAPQSEGKTLPPQHGHHALRLKVTPANSSAASI